MTKVESRVLTYGGSPIHIAGERLNLTDMWKAAGSPPNKEPFNWVRFEGASFVDAVAVNLNLSVAQVYRTKQGRNGGSEAHWQVGLAYAKYLSDEFHMWCNSVVRAVVEGGHGNHRFRDELAARRVRALEKITAIRAVAQVEKMRGRRAASQALPGIYADAGMMLDLGDDRPEQPDLFGDEEGEE